MQSIAITSVLQRKVRSAISAFAIALGVATMLILFGLAYGSLGEVVDRIKGVGADIIIQRSGSPTMLGVRTGVMDVSLGDELENIEIEFDGKIVNPIKKASPVLVWVAKVDGQVQNVYGIDANTFLVFGESMQEHILEGRLMRGNNEIIIDDRLAGSAEIAVGDSVEMMGDSFEVVGIIQSGAGARVFMDILNLQTLTEEKGKCSAFYLNLSDPKYIKPTVEIFERDYKWLTPTTMESLAQSMKKSLAGLNQFMSAIISVALGISALVILLAMYTTIIERTREIGILKALGASKWFIIRTILVESLILCVIGVIVGVGLAWGVKFAMLKFYPLLTVEITLIRIFWAAVLGIIVGVLAALYPAYMAASKDPVEALQHD